MRRLWTWLTRTRPCRCDGCLGITRGYNSNPRVSQGLHMWVGKDDKLHWRATSSIRA